MRLRAPAGRTIPLPRIVPIEQPGRPGCYWDWERAAWVAWPIVPPPRRPQD